MNQSIDLNKITHSTNNYNFHTHTQFCDGHDTIDAMCGQAVRCNYSHLGFSPHSPIAIPSPCNMKTSDVKSYLQAIEQAKSKYPSLNIYAGMEMDFLDSAEITPTQQLIDTSILDYKISSVHFIKDNHGLYVDIDGSSERFKRNLIDFFDNNLSIVLERFFNSSIAMIEQGGFDIIGHYDKIAMNASAVDAEIETTRAYLEMADALTNKIINAGITVEINTKAYDKYNRIYPHPRHWEKLIKANIPIIINSDAHYANKLTAGREYALYLLQDFRNKLNPKTYIVA